MVNPFKIKLPGFGSKVGGEALDSAAKEALEKAAKEAGEKAAKEAAERGLSEAAQQSAREAAEQSVFKKGLGDTVGGNIGESVGNTTKGVVGGSLKFTTQELAVPLIRAVGPSAALAGIGIYIVNSLGNYFSETIDEIKNDVQELLCDSEDDSQSCELIVNSAIGLGGITLVGGLVVLGLFITRR